MEDLQKYIDQINQLVKEDQTIRAKLTKNGDNTKIWAEMKIADDKSTLELKKIISKVGFPTISKFGKQASNNAWLLVQHSPDLEFQKHYLEQLKENSNDINKKNIAYLEDRVLMFENKPQKYGTQMRTNKTTGKMDLYEVEDRENLNKRRAEFGMEPIEEYLKNFD